MEKFTELTAVAVPMDEANIDTDQIIPARFLRKPRSAGYHHWLFHDLRFDAEQKERADFVLNQPPYRDARILVAGENFGCGSSREGAVWALAGAGFRVLIAASFGDILFNNCFKNGVVPVVLAAAETVALRQALHARPGTTLTVSLEQQTVAGPSGVYRFAIDPFRKQCLLTGQDEYQITEQYLGDIEAFERRQRLLTPAYPINEAPQT